MIRQDSAAIQRWAIVAGFAIVAGSLLNLPAFTQQGGGATPVLPNAGRGGRGGIGQGTPVRGPNEEVWGFTDTAFNATRGGEFTMPSVRNRQW